MSADSRALREQLVATIRQSGALRVERVARAFLAVPREDFLPGLPLERVYQDDAIVTKTEDGVGVSSSSQPAMMAIMLEQLDLAPGMRVLEIGAGTGYNAALLRELVALDGSVTTIDIDPEVCGWARERLDRAGYPDVAVHEADGADGWPAGAPYDRIELTVGALDIAPAWVEQLVEGGLLVLPLWLRAGQLSIAFERRGDTLVSRSLVPCGFMRMRGRLAGEREDAELLPRVIVSGDGPLPAAALRELLASAPAQEPWPGSLWDGFALHAGLRGLPILSIYGSDPAVFDGVGFGLFDAGAGTPSFAVVAGDGQGGPVELLVWGGASARARLHAAFEQWTALGRPEPRRLRVTAWPLAAAPDPAPGELSVDTRWWRLIFAGAG